jgi:hypothetical protein
LGIAGGCLKIFWEKWGKNVKKIFQESPLKNLRRWGLVKEVLLKRRLAKGRDSSLLNWAADSEERPLPSPSWGFSNMN